jgi:hypothetical protein
VVKSNLLLSSSTGHLVDVLASSRSHRISLWVSFENFYTFEHFMKVPF